MADVYATIEHADDEVVSRLAEVLELRASDLQQRAMLDRYLHDLPLPDGARVLEIGCGPGPIARTLAGLTEVGEVVGIDPSPLFVEGSSRGDRKPDIRMR
jgi:cyclopropane fatty-acyl-phospholipid synthase-like methyltransferase